MRTGTPNYRLSGCGLCKEMVLYSEVTKLVYLDHFWNLYYCVVFAQRWSLYTGNMRVVIKYT